MHAIFTRLENADLGKSAKKITLNSVKNLSTMVLKKPILKVVTTNAIISIQLLAEIQSKIGNVQVKSVDSTI